MLQFLTSESNTIYYGVGITVFLVIISFLWFISAPFSFTPDTIVSIVPGSSVQHVGKKLHDENIIRSPQIFQMVLVAQSKEGSVVAGDYIFQDRSSLFQVIKRITRGDFQMDQRSITIPEGFTVDQIGALVEEKEIGLKEDFIQQASEYEGFLFPDTYRIQQGLTIPKFIEMLQSQFQKKIAPLQQDIEASGKSLQDIVIMASLIEREAITDKERPIVSGILWNRIRIGMPLQVDAPFLVYLGKTSAQLTIDDLQTPAPYNTYTNKGLPPTPIGNPGLASLRAALYPEKTDFLFYLHGSDGKIRYGKTHDDHIRNKNLYLR